MTAPFWIQIALVLGAIVALAYPLGGFMAAFFDGRPTRLDVVFAPAERLLLALVGVRGEPLPMGWRRYAVAMLASNAFMAALVFGVLVGQGLLPLNPMRFGGMEPMQAFNTAASFVTNTNWQSYGGESTLSYLSQMTLAFLQFTSAATGICAAIAFLRGLAGRPDFGNFYADLVKVTVRVLLPLSILVGALLMQQGVPQTLAPSQLVIGPQGTAQTLPVGPVASMVSIKHLGTNGGGYYSQNSSHPFENPTPLTDVLQNVSLLVISVGLVFAFGRMVGSRRQAAVVFGVMALLFAASFGVMAAAETAGSPALSALGLDQTASELQAGGNMEGKEVRFGQALTTLLATSTTATSTGTVNAMHDSLMPVAGMMPIVNMMLNDVFGGVGVGLLNFVLYGVLAVFLTGLMVGRTPEFLGKKIEKPEIVLASIALLIHPLIVLAPTAISAVSPFGLASLANAGPHGLSEILYAFTSAAANNGSAFAGLGADTPWYNLALGVVILLGRYPGIIAMLAIAGSLAGKRRAPEGPGTLRTDTPLFGGVFLATILIVGALTFFPAFVLGPIAEHLAMLAGKRF